MKEALNNLPDDALALAARDGDEQAMRELYERYRDRIAAYAHRITRDRSEALDVLQETFEYLFRKLPTYRPEGKLSALLYTAARNLSLNKLKKKRRMPTSSIDEVKPGTSGEADPASVLEDKESARAALNAMETLSPEHREVVELRILEGLPYAEIAEIAGIPIGTVKSRLHNALENLRKKLK